MSNPPLELVPDPDDCEEQTEPGRPQRVTVSEMLREIRALSNAVAGLAGDVRALAAKIERPLTFRRVAIECGRWALAFGLFGLLLWWLR